MSPSLLQLQGFHEQKVKASPVSWLLVCLGEGFETLPVIGDSSTPTHDSDFQHTIRATRTCDSQIFPVKAQEFHVHVMQTPAIRRVLGLVALLF